MTNTRERGTQRRYPAAAIAVARSSRQVQGMGGTGSPP
jgi:hypothetical protein